MSTAELAPSIQLGFDSAGLRMTPEEFDAVDDWDELYRYELVDSVLVVREFDVESIAAMNELSSYLLYSWIRRQRDDSLRTLPNRYISLPRSRRLAHRLIWTNYVCRPSAPAVAMDFVTDGLRRCALDYLQKRDEYLAIGVQEYWIIDRFERTMTVHKKTGDHAQTVVHEGEVYTTELLPGFELPFDELLSAADDWEDDE